MTAFPGLSRTSEKKPVLTQYFMIYEGECTEKDYFDGVSKAAESCKLKLKITPKEIERFETEWFETNILRLIAIANSYIESLKKKKFHELYFANMILEPFCRVKRTEYIQNGKYKTAYPNYLKTVIKPYKDKLLNDLKRKKLIDDHGFITSTSEAVNYCRNDIKMKFKFDIAGKIRKEDIDRRSVESCDQVCIIHDRDYSEKYFNDIAYMQAIRETDWLTKNEGERYRLIITYPKFELWLVMHLMKEKDLTTLNYNYLKNYSGSDSCPFKEPSKTGPSQYVADLFEQYYHVKQTKHIGELFDKVMLSNIKNAIEISKAEPFTTDVKELMSNPGTNMGLLMDEIINTNNSREAFCL